MIYQEYIGKISNMESIFLENIVFLKFWYIIKYRFYENLELKI